MGAGEPLAVTVNVAACPEGTVWLTGCAVIAGADCFGVPVEDPPLLPQPCSEIAQITARVDIVNRAMFFRAISGKKMAAAGRWQVTFLVIPLSIVPQDTTKFSLVLKRSSLSIASIRG